MQKPDWLLSQPSYSLTPAISTAFDRLFDESCQTGDGQAIMYDLPYPKWQFLSYLAATKDIVLHGSYLPALARIEPRQASDIRAASAQNAIYATTDGIWAIFFAILDRARFPMGLHNTCLRVRLDADRWSESMYFFSITRSALEQHPWCEGAVYILPRAGFALEQPQMWGSAEVAFPHWIGRQPAQPYARLPVAAADFPFLARIHGHDDAALRERAARDPAGYPWLD